MKALVAALVLASGATAYADDWELRVDADVDVTTGAATKVSLTIVSENGRVISKDGPLRITVASDTLTLPRKRYDRKQAADPAADAPRFDLALTAPTSGDHALAIDARFWICGKKVCVPVHATRTIAVHAKTP